MIDEHEITKKAYEKKTEIISEANNMYREVMKDSNSYADDILAKVQEELTDLSNVIADMQNSLQDKLNTIKNNRNELK